MAKSFDGIVSAFRIHFQKTMQRTSLISALLLTVVLSACHRGLSVRKASLDSYGIYEEERAGRVENPANSAGYVNFSDSQKLLKSTDVVEAKLGVTFGIVYTPVGRPADALIKTVVRLKHPPITNPQTGKVFDLEEDPHEDVIGLPTFSGFTFEKEWEIAPGKWSYQVYYGSRKILEKSFTVVDGRK